MQKKIKRFLKGFTVIELVVSIAVIAFLTVLITTNYRQGEKARGVQLGTDVVASAFRTVESLSVNPKSIQTNCNLGDLPKDYLLVISTSSKSFTLNAHDKCGSLVLLDTYNLPNNIIFPQQELRIDSGGSNTENLYFKFTPPFSKVLYARDANSSYQNFRKALIGISYSDGSNIKYIGFSSATGKIEVANDPGAIYSD